MRSTLCLAAGGLLAGSVACEAPRLTSPHVPPVAFRRAPTDSAGVLIVVDGKVLPRGAGLDDLRANDIESLEVIKSTDTPPLYGAEAVSVAIIIFTKTAEHSHRSPSR